MTRTEAEKQYHDLGYATVYGHESAGRVYPPHNHEESHLYTLSGALQIKVGEQGWITLPPESDFLVRAGELHEAVVGEQGWEYIIGTSTRTISAIYDTYKIMTNLREHQLRVAAVAKLICDNLTVPVDTWNVVAASLLHDMGNILKFDLARFPEWLAPEGLAYWQEVKESYAAQYGPDEHAATLAIAREIDVSQTTIQHLEAIGFMQASRTAASINLGEKICCYADQRVAPYGVLSLTDRLSEGRKRYAERHQFGSGPAEFETGEQSLKVIEKEVFAQSKISPNDITDSSIAPLLQELSTTLI